MKVAASYLRQVASSPLIHRVYQHTYVHTYVLKLLDIKTKETAEFGLFPPEPNDDVTKCYTCIVFLVPVSNI